MHFRSSDLEPRRSGCGAMAAIQRGSGSFARSAASAKREVAPSASSSAVRNGSCAAACHPITARSLGDRSCPRSPGSQAWTGSSGKSSGGDNTPRNPQRSASPAWRRDAASARAPDEPPTRRRQIRANRSRAIKEPAPISAAVAIRRSDARCQMPSRTSPTESETPFPGEAKFTLVRSPMRCDRGRRSSSCATSGNDRLARGRLRESGHKALRSGRSRRSARGGILRKVPDGTAGP